METFHLIIFSRVILKNYFGNFHKLLSQTFRVCWESKLDKNLFMGGEGPEVIRSDWDLGNHSPTVLMAPADMGYLVILCLNFFSYIPK